MTRVEIKAKHAIITPVCRANRGVVGAFDEAVQRLREEYERLAAVGLNEKADFHLILSIERESRSR